MMMAGIGSVAGGLMGLFGGGGDQASPQRVDIGPATSHLTGQNFGGIGNLSQYNLGGQNLGQYSSTMQQGINNPYAQFGLNNTMAFANAGMGSAAQGLGNAQQLGNMVNPLIQTAFDPQNALYARTADQVSQQSLAGLSNSGLATTPWGQGVYGQTMGNFNIDWQNNQLQRQLAGAQGAGQLAGTAYGLGSSAGMGGAQFGMLPYGTYGQINTDKLNTLAGGAAYGNTSSAIPQTAVGDWLSYMNAGTAANNTAINQQAQNFKQDQAYGQQIGQGLYALGSPYSMGSSPFMGSMFM